ncbi:hypothetical protein vseg_008319 [Gypsophila vaccaria]
MNFFKSVFSDDPPSPPSQTLIPSATSADDDAAVFGGVRGGAWNFGGFIETISSKSESVLETYRRDLQEFTAGLKTETETLRNVAATSLDVGASKAQVSLESVGDVIDSLGAAVTGIIFHSSAAADESPPAITRGADVKYSRYEAQLLAIQMDERTYLEENSEGGEKEEFERWKLGFNLGEFGEEVSDFMNKAELRVIYDRLVPNVVDSEAFWLRYFYRIHRLKKAEVVRAELVKRAAAGGGDEEELSWDVDDVEDEDNVVVEEENVEEKAEEKAGEKGEVSEGSKDSDISVVSMLREEEEEDLGWDEIEEEELRGTRRVESPKREELRKRLSAAEEEDLSWDIEDDDDDDLERVKG